MDVRGSPWESLRDPSHRIPRRREGSPLSVGLILPTTPGTTTSGPDRVAARDLVAHELLDRPAAVEARRGRLLIGRVPG